MCGPRGCVWSFPPPLRAHGPAEQPDAGPGPGRGDICRGERGSAADSSRRPDFLVEPELVSKAERWP